MERVTWSVSDQWEWSPLFCSPKFSLPNEAERVALTLTGHTWRTWDTWHVNWKVKMTRRVVCFRPSSAGGKEKPNFSEICVRLCAWHLRDSSWELEFFVDSVQKLYLVKSELIHLNNFGKLKQNKLIQVQNLLKNVQSLNLKKNLCSFAYLVWSQGHAFIFHLRSWVRYFMPRLLSTAGVARVTTSSHVPAFSCSNTFHSLWLFLFFISPPPSSRFLPVVSKTISPVRGQGDLPLFSFLYLAR